MSTVSYSRLQTQPQTGFGQPQGGFRPRPEPCPVIATLGRGYPLYACTSTRGCELLNPRRESVQIRGCFNTYPRPIPFPGATTPGGNDSTITLI
ncbi:Hypothetical protein BRZCDTV_32 [Brazilian cedratvirus IHUMI]|uniref:Uncharacterized protein n=1 Tax=Brazilian cedratvirus IHUMI TaxID=2126980 RepID=A0A2R8FCW9_9VIRU|nr:Hypothetical protein BRZCDTV_32 [Brazilian cedratvirus IHUMI]